MIYAAQRYKWSSKSTSYVASMMQSLLPHLGERGAQGLVKGAEQLADLLLEGLAQAKPHRGCHDLQDQKLACSVSSWLLLDDKACTSRQTLF